MSDVVAVIPGGGWMIEYKNGETAWAEPILAWMFREDGSCTPIVTDSFATVESVTKASSFKRIYHPGIIDLPAPKGDAQS